MTQPTATHRLNLKIINFSETREGRRVNRLERGEGRQPVIINRLNLSSFENKFKSQFFVVRSENSREWRQREKMDFRQSQETKDLNNGSWRQCSRLLNFPKIRNKLNSRDGRLGMWKTMPLETSCSYRFISIVSVDVDGWQGFRREKTASTRNAQLGAGVKADG